MPKPKLTLIVTVRGPEPHLDRTLRLARETAGAPIQRVVVFDGADKAPDDMDAEDAVVLKRARGVQYARHAGIQRAACSLIVCTDSHMGFSVDWATALSSWKWRIGQHMCIGEMKKQHLGANHGLQFRGGCAVCKYDFRHVVGHQ